MFSRRQKVKEAATNPTRPETEEERLARLEPQIAKEMDNRFAKEQAANHYLKIRALGELAKRVESPADEERIPIYPAVRPAFAQIREDSINHGNPHMEGVRWVDFKGAQETRVHRSFEVRPLRLVETSSPATGKVGRTAQSTKKFWSGSKKHWEFAPDAERRWILEDSDRKVNSDERPIEYKPRKPVDIDGLEAVINGEIGRNEAVWPQWFARGERPDANVRPIDALPPRHTYPITLPTTGNMFEAVTRYAAGNNEYNQEFDCDLIGLSWTGMVQNTWDDLDYKNRMADGSLPPALDCEITDTWDYVGEGGNAGKSWLEERRYQGVLVDVVVHDTKSMVNRLQKAFAPTGSVAGITCVPAENIAWQVQDTAGPAVPTPSGP